MPSWDVLISMLCSILPFHLMSHICPVDYIFVAMNMPKWCSSFLLTSWCHVVSLLLINLCIFWRCSNYMSWSISCLIHAHVSFMITNVSMLAVMCLQSQHHNVIVLHSQISRESAYIMFASCLDDYHEPVAHMVMPCCVFWSPWYVLACHAFSCHVLAL